ncbi:hypothetical protein EB796_001752 [Bugula neritina]|uniref:Uncharacterized protein n=1 Tax=Bugula neritina TaxID=10212 RepID=A0A7J7KNY5_BUGNE|nr:hypothetical protein EB796_001752 [Bugula neritina]
MNKETLSQHYNLDLDSLFAAGGVSNPTPAVSTVLLRSFSVKSQLFTNKLSNKRASLPPTLPTACQIQLSQPFHGRHLLLQ